MFKKFKEWRLRRVTRIKAKQRRAGYNYAAGELLRVKPVDRDTVLLELQDQADNWYDNDPFDRGISDALWDYTRQFIRRDAP